MSHQQNPNRPKLVPNNSQANLPPSLPSSLSSKPGSTPSHPTNMTDIPPLTMPMTDTPGQTISTNQLPPPIIPPDELISGSAGQGDSKPAITKNDKIIEELTKFYAGVGMFVSRADMYDGILLIREARNRAEELVNVAKHHKGMLKMLERLVESNDYITMAVGHGLMFYAIMAHHGRIKADEAFLAQIGYHEKQVLALPEGMPQDGVTAGSQNGAAPVAASAI